MSNRRAVAELIQARLSELYRTARHLCGSAQRAEDLVQETCARALQGAEGFRPGTKDRSWLYTIMVNVLRNEQKRAAIAPQVPSGDIVDLDAFRPEPSDSPERELVDAAFDDEVEAALATLPHEYREVVLLCDVGELSYQDCAQVLGCPIGTVRSRLSRGRQMLFERLAEYARSRRLRPRSGDGA